jgi:NTP pyrophosphatase (non-canonical NTP hydrolase)
MTDATATLADLKALMGKFVADRDWGQFHAPKNLAMAVAAEAAELMEHFLWVDLDASRQLAQGPERGAIADEMADVLGALLALSNSIGLDLAAAFEAKMARNELKYPVDKARGRYRID